MVLAGGEGTRVAEITRGEIPKALIPVSGIPFLDYKIDSLIKIGFTELTFLLGKHSDQIVDHMTQYISSDVEVNCITEANPLGTGGAVLAALGVLPNTFWVTYADSLVYPDVQALESIDVVSSSDKSIMCVIRGNDEWGRSNVELDSGQVSFYSRDRTDSSGHDLCWIEYGLLRLSKNAFRDFENKTRFDLGEVVQSQVLKKSMLPLVCKERFREVGNVRSFYETEQWISSNFGGHSVKALFLDRDGVLNSLVSRDGGWFSPQSIEDFQVSKGAGLVLHGFRNLGFSIFVVTNQPDISRGSLQQETLLRFHQLLIEELGPLEFFTCSHTSEANCDCRKPKSGLITSACTQYSIDIPTSWLIGDQVSDIIAGRAAGLKTVLLYSPATPASIRQFPNEKADLEVYSLEDAFTLISSCK